MNCVSEQHLGAVFQVVQDIVSSLLSLREHLARDPSTVTEHIYEDEMERP
jgi:hypothetical protein